jgi:hypothetical protein
VYYVTVRNLQGKALIMLPKPKLETGIDISSLPAGMYLLDVMDTKTKSLQTVKFIKN